MVTFEKLFRWMDEALCAFGEYHAEQVVGDPAHTDEYGHFKWNEDCPLCYLSQDGCRLLKNAGWDIYTDMEL